ncbi:phosphatase PAP2 family protein [Penaeicola halotolerans]|uniref:phosphatase PAP2 family protein n=1 Tax=Penaeicola halotolerans TaxID=2793196 RepID=UPI001CF8B4DC|nr:phosphatase PAP2 family protein [Penaeicola halotolerans]
MIEQLIEWDVALFLWLNGKHADWLDPIMSVISGRIEWVPFYLLLIYLMYRQFGKNTLWLLVGVGVVILIADQTASGIMKPYFERFRPCQDPDISHLVHTYKRCGGKYGFASSHASNTFGLATFIFLMFREKKWAKWMFLWAAIVSYSRIYLGVHFPADIIVGALIGVIAGYIGYLVTRKLMLKKNLNF